ncbi:MAG: contractile injection system tape measure protein, partial [Pseudomonadota bacterium]
MTTQGRIGRLTFDFELARQATAEPIQDRLSDYFSNRLPAVIEHCLERLDLPDEADLILSNLQLDLGDLPLDELEDEMDRRLTEALLTELRRLRLPDAKSHSPPTNVAPDGASGTGSDLEQYLLTGRYTHWPGTEAPDLVHLLHAALDSNPATLLSLLQEHREHTGLRERLRLHLTVRLRLALSQAARADPDRASGLAPLFASLAIPLHNEIPNHRVLKSEGARSERPSDDIAKDLDVDPDLGSLPARTSTSPDVSAGNASRKFSGSKSTRPGTTRRADQDALPTRSAEQGSFRSTAAFETGAEGSDDRHPKAKREQSTRSSSQKPTAPTDLTRPQSAETVTPQHRSLNDTAAPADPFGSELQDPDRLQALIQHIEQEIWSGAGLPDYAARQLMEQTGHQEHVPDNAVQHLNIQSNDAL